MLESASSVHKSGVNGSGRRSQTGVVFTAWRPLNSIPSAQPARGIYLDYGGGMETKGNVSDPLTLCIKSLMLNAKSDEARGLDSNPKPLNRQAESELTCPPPKGARKVYKRLNSAPRPAPFEVAADIYFCRHWSRNPSLSFPRAARVNVPICTEWSRNLGI